VRAILCQTHGVIRNRQAAPPATLTSNFKGTYFLAPLRSEIAMTHWIVFEESAAEATRHSGQVEERHDSGVAEALQEAAHDARTVVLVVPAGEQRAIVARVAPVVRGS